MTDWLKLDWREVWHTAPSTLNFAKLPLDERQARANAHLEQTRFASSEAVKRFQPQLDAELAKPYPDARSVKTCRKYLRQTQEHFTSVERWHARETTRIEARRRKK